MPPGEKKSSVSAVLYYMGRADNVLLFLTGLSLVLLTFMLTLDVVMRFLFNKPFPAGAETSELIMAYIVFLPLGYTLSKGMHIRITALFEYIPAKAKLFFDIIADVLGLAFCIVVTYFAWKFFLHSFSIREEMLAVVKLPWYVGKFAMPVGFFFFTLWYVVGLITDWKRFFNS